MDSMVNPSQCYAAGRHLPESDDHTWERCLPALRQNANVYSTALTDRGVDLGPCFAARKHTDSSDHPVQLCIPVLTYDDSLNGTVMQQILGAHPREGSTHAASHDPGTPALYGTAYLADVDFPPQQVGVIGELVRSSSGNTIMRAGHYQPGEAWWRSGAAHIALTPDERDRLIADLSEHRPPPLAVAERQTDQWAEFLSLVPEEGYDTPAARFLIDVLTEISTHATEILHAAKKISS